LNSNIKKLLVLVLTLSLVATFIAPLPVAKANGAEPRQLILGRYAANLLPANATTTGEDKHSGEGSWYVNSCPKFEIYLTPESLGLENLSINDIKTISYWTKKTHEGAQDFSLNIYTKPDDDDDESSWYGYRLNAEPYFSEDLTAPAGEWNKWSTDEGPNQLTFYDSAKIGGTFGFYGQPTLQELQNVTFNWYEKYQNPSYTNQDIDYGNEQIMYISFQTGSGWCSDFAGYIDDIYIELTTGEIVTIDLEDVSNTVYVNASWDTELLGRDPDGTEGPATSFGYDAFSKIQDAIDYVEPGGTISINPGTYIEDLTIDKAINLIGVSDEDGEKPVIKGTGAPNEGTNSVNMKLVAGSSGSVIDGLKFEAREGEQVKSWTGNNTYYSIMLKAGSVAEPIENVKIMNSTFFTDIDQPLGYHAVAIEAEAGSENTLIESCAFDGGYYVTVQGKNNTNGLKVETSTITNAKSGINIMGGSNITVNDTYIKVIAQAPGNDTYAVRVGSSYPTTNAEITRGTFIVDKKNLETDQDIYHSAIIIRSGAQGDLSIKGATVIGEVVNLSTAILDASGNYWGTDEGPFNTSFKGTGPIVIKNWLDRNGNEVDLVSRAQKVPAPGSTGVSLETEVKIVFPSEVQMDTTKEIAITTNGSKLSGVSATLQGDGKTVIVTHPPFAYGTQYTVNVPGGTFKATLGEDDNVQVLAEQPTSWSFTTAARPLPPPPPEEPTPPGAEEPLPDSAIEEAISEAEETGEVVLSAPEEEDTLALTLDQLSTIGETEKPVVVNIGEVQMELPAAVVSNLAELTGAQVEIKVAELSSTAAEELHGQATNADQYKLAGAIFEITMELVKSDGSREDITDLGGKVKVYVPVPSDKQELAAAGLLTVARFNENTEAWEEIPSSFDEDTKCMIFETAHFSKYAVLEKVLDTAAPTVVNTDPVDNATNVPIDKLIKVTFNEEVVSATNFDKITLAVWGSIIRIRFKSTILVPS